MILAIIGKRSSLPGTSKSSPSFLELVHVCVTSQKFRNFSFFYLTGSLKVRIMMHTRTFCTIGIKKGWKTGVKCQDFYGDAHKKTFEKLSLHRNAFLSNCQWHFIPFLKIFLQLISWFFLKKSWVTFVNTYVEVCDAMRWCFFAVAPIFCNFPLFWSRGGLPSDAHDHHENWLLLQQTIPK